MTAGRCPHCGRILRECCESLVLESHLSSCGWAALIDAGDVAAAAAWLDLKRRRDRAPVDELEDGDRVSPVLHVRPAVA